MNHRHAGGNELKRLPKTGDKIWIGNRAGRITAIMKEFRAFSALFDDGLRDVFYLRDFYWNDLAKRWQRISFIC